MSKGNMRVIFMICILSFITSCSREVHYAVDGFFFSVKGLTKTELIVVLDSFSESENFDKLSEGGDKMLPEVKINFMMAAYKNEHGYGFLVNNVLNKSCFSVATYDKKHNGEFFAKELSAKLTELLKQKYKGSLILYADKYCEIAH
ncbi:hypothetical protein [Pseudoalteromonas sp. TB64]|uniref:hypothetical protein n=1 Tax=Pseudoalteromonas sp. TB64 TaxID=1938600 RepID=UPI0011111BDC|nr:hypothetical protein [Pseudoalteromonas sp. TB64]